MSDTNQARCRRCGEPMDARGRHCPACGAAVHGAAVRGCLAALAIVAGGNLMLVGAAAGLCASGIDRSSGRSAAAGIAWLVFAAGLLLVAVTIVALSNSARRDGEGRDRRQF